MNRLMRRPRPDCTTACAIRKAMTTSRTLVFANPANAFEAEIVFVRTTAPAASMVDVNSGSTPISTERIAVTKIANRCHACGVSPAGTGYNQMAIAMMNGKACLATRRGSSMRGRESRGDGTVVVSLISVALLHVRPAEDQPPPAQRDRGTC